MVACRCSRCRRGVVLSGLVFESLRVLMRPHCVVESRRPFCPVGLVAGGVTELVIIVGGGSVKMESVPVLTVLWPTVRLGNSAVPLLLPLIGFESDAVELVDGRDSCRFGISVAMSESLRFRVAFITFGGGGVNERPMAESRRLLLG